MSPIARSITKAALLFASLVAAAFYPTVAIAFVLLLLSIVVHEAGHLWAARLVGVPAPHFTVGFGPKLFAWVFGSTEYRLRAIPLGGYVSLPPLVGAASSIPYRHKMLILAAGCYANLLFALAIMSVLWHSSDPDATVVESVPSSIVRDGQPITNPLAGALRPGDRVISVNSARVYWSADVLTEVRANGFHTLVVDRDGVTIELHPQISLETLASLSGLGFTLRSSTVVESVQRNSAAARAGLHPGDECIALDGAPLAGTPPGDAHGRFTFRRSSKVFTVALPADAGVTWKRFPLFAAPTPMEQFGQTARLMANGIRGARFSGPIGIIMTLAYMAAHSLAALLWATMLLNISLALFNLLPLPLMDGGQAVMATIERIRGRHLNPAWVQIAFGATMILLVIVAFIASIADIESLASAAQR